MADDGTLRLRVITEDGAETEHVVTLPVVLGRDPDRVDLVLSDRMVSRRHARLESDDGRVVLVDLDSANGTWLGDEPVTRRALGPDDVVTVGAHTVRWVPETPEVPEDPGPDLGSAGGVVLDDAGLRFLPLGELHAGWRRAVRRLDAIARDAAHDAVAPALEAFLDEELDRIAAPTTSLCAPGMDVDGYRRRLAWIRALPAHAARRDHGTAALEAEDRRLAVEMADALRDGLAAFDEHGVDVVRIGADRLMGALKNTLVAVHQADARAAEPGVPR
ncbi:FHA domain-containing protein [Actinomycetospora flava]|uniref:FHA domain-containing protein n=1 Tax=Actinomycetospora flava TaxID=3129232 RepID=A0ABU8MBS0_9PSEU